MKIKYLGHSCFVLESDAGTRIVTDPYGNMGRRVVLPCVSADVVTVSHRHHDHCNVSAVGGSPAVIDRAGSFTVRDISISASESFHDEVGGTRRGKNLIFTFTIDGLKVTHLGDLGEPLASERLMELCAAAPHVVLIPVGGIYTIDPVAAKTYVERLHPPVVIPMHYGGRDGLDASLAPPERFAEQFLGKAGYSVEHAGSELELSVPERGSTKIYIMEREKA